MPPDGAAACGPRASPPSSRAIQPPSTQRAPPSTTDERITDLDRGRSRRQPAKKKKKKKKKSSSTFWSAIRVRGGAIAKKRPAVRSDVREQRPGDERLGRRHRHRLRPQVEDRRHDRSLRHEADAPDAERDRAETAQVERRRRGVGEQGPVSQRAATQKENGGPGSTLDCGCAGIAALSAPVPALRLNASTWGNRANSTSGGFGTVGLGRRAMIQWPECWTHSSADPVADARSARGPGCPP